MTLETPFARSPLTVLSLAKAYRPTPAGDGTMFIASDMAGHAQVYRLDGPQRFPERLAPGQDRTIPVADTPLGLLARTDRDGDEAWQLGLVAREGGPTRLTADRKAIHTSVVVAPGGRRAGLAYNPGGQADWVLGVIDLESGRIQNWVERGGYWRWLAWNEDGSLAAVVRQESSLVNECHLVEGPERSRRILDGMRSVAETAWAEGRLYAVATPEGSDFSGLFEVDQEAGSVLRTLVLEDRDVIGLSVDPTGRRAAVVVNEGAYDSLRALDLGTGRELWRGELAPGIVYQDNSTSISEQMAWNATGESLFVAWESPLLPAEVWELPAAVCWTRAGGEPVSGLARPESVSYPTFDGRAVPALHYRAPAGSDAAVVLFHGGPEGQSRGSFNPMIGMWLAAGYDVLAPNVRGSKGYGFRYTSLDDRELRWDSVRDGCAAGRWLKQTRGVRHLIAMGGSYGGFMTLGVLVEEPELWAAGIDIVGIADWHTFFRNTSGWRRSQRAAEYGDPDGPDGEFLARFSPLRRADAIRAHLLVIHGRNDVRVPVSEADQIHRAVAGSELLVFDDEGHGIMKHRNRVLAFGRALAFVEERLGRSG